MRHVLTILAVRDSAIARAFYRVLLPAWTVSVEVPPYLELAEPVSGMRIGLYARTGFAVNVGRLPTELTDDAIASAELYFHDPDPEAAIARALAHGATMLSTLAPRGWGEDVAYVRDPDGHVIAIARG